MNLKRNIDEKGNLVVEIDEAARTLGATAQEAEEYIHESLTGNGYSTVRPEEIGALTDAPIFTDASRKDNGDLDADKDSQFWWFPNYQIEGMGTVLLREGRVVLEKAQEMA